MTSGPTGPRWTWCTRRRALLDAMTPPRLDLVVDVDGLRHADARPHADARGARVRARCPLLLLDGAGRRQGPHSRRVAGPRRSKYWLNPVPPRAESLPPVTNDAYAAPPGVEWAHTIGWRRLVA